MAFSLCEKYNGDINVIREAAGKSKKMKQEKWSTSTVKYISNIIFQFGLSKIQFWLLVLVSRDRK